jgi:hypothetical protein
VREAEVQAAFVRHLLERGWDVTTENPDYTDVIARRGTERIVAEVKGHTSSPGLDVDTAYGQLLRRMTPDLVDAGTVFALVVPETLAPKVERVDAAVRRRLGIELYLVSDLGGVRRND